MSGINQSASSEVVAYLGGGGGGGEVVLCVVGIVKKLRTQRNRTGICGHGTGIVGAKRSWSLSRARGFIPDKLWAHKNEQILALIRNAGVEVSFLPAYSPNLNPIVNDMGQGEGSPAQSPDSRVLRSAQCHCGCPRVRFIPGRPRPVRRLWR